MTSRPHDVGIGVVVLNYDVEAAMLDACLRSVLASTGVAKGDTAVLRQLLVVDNCSPTRQADAERVVDGLEDVTPAGVSLGWLALPRNYGFAGGINRGIASLDDDCTLVFLLNPDAEVAPDALALCAARLLEADASCVAVAPKMLLAGFEASPAGDASPGGRSGDDGDERVGDEEHVGDEARDTAGNEADDAHADDADGYDVIDSIGNAINDRGEAFNIGLGQPDLGQYDVPSACFGPCFGAGLFHRSAFDPELVGPLDERLFLYYEDVDWNWRCQLLGFDALTEPRAVVRHVMSATTRHLDYGFKFRLTERNLLLCALKNFDSPRALWIWTHRGAGLTRGSVRGHYPVPGIRAVAGALRLAPGVLADRRRVQRRRVRSDDDVLAYGLDERTFFDAVTYEPIDREDALAYARLRAARVRAANDPSSEAATDVGSDVDR